MSQQQEQQLITKRDKLSETIERLRLQLDEALNEKFEIDMEIQRLHFIGNSSSTKKKEQDPECAALQASFEKVKQQFEQSCKTPKEYDSDVPYKCSDDFADTSAFDDWTDQQLEVFRDRMDQVMSVAELDAALLEEVSNSSDNNNNSDKIKKNGNKNDSSKQNRNNNSNSAAYDKFSSGIESALKILFRTTEAINSMVEIVSNIDGAEGGILLECRDHIMEHWRNVLGDEALIDKSPEERAEGIDERFTKFFQLNPDFGEMLCNELERVGKPFSLLVAVPNK